MHLRYQPALALDAAQVYASEVGSEPKAPPDTDDKEPLDDLDDLDIDAQIDDLAAALQFELDDDEEAEVGDGLLPDDDLALPEDPPTVVEGRKSASDLAAGSDMAFADDPPTLPDPEPESEALEPDDDLALADEDPETYIGAEPIDDSVIAELDDEELEELDDADLDEVPETASGAIDTGSAPRGEPARPLYLEVGDQVAKVDTERFVIGRVSKMCDFAIIDVNISRQHCAIERRGSKYYIVDLGSTNGVQVDGKRVDNHEIRQGDVFVLSGHEMSASFFAPLPAARPAPASVAPASSPVAETSTPHVTGRLEPVPAAGSPAPSRAKSEPAASAPAEATPAAASPKSAPLSGAPGFTQAVVDPLGPEASALRLEHKIDQLTQQVAYLQQAVQVLIARTDALSGLGPLANMIQSRLAQKGGR